jgi:hypothetical protein
MSWIVVGDSDTATFACNTVDRSFGPLHHSYHAGESAKEQLRNFGDWLEDDPRTYGEDKLVEKYHDWRSP